MSPSPYLIAGIVAFVIFDALVLVFVLSLADRQRQAKEAQQAAERSTTTSAARPDPAPVAFDVLLRELMPQLGAPMLAHMLNAGHGSEADPRALLRWAAGKEKPLGLGTDRRLRTIHEVVTILSPKLSNRQIRRWFNQANSRTHGLPPAQAIRRDYLVAVVDAAKADAGFTST